MQWICGVRGLSVRSVATSPKSECVQPLSGVRIRSEDCYQALKKSFSLEVPKKFNFARDVFDQWVMKQPEACAVWIVDEERNSQKYSYLQLKEDSKKLASALQRHKVGRGDVVFVVLPRTYEWWVINMACLRLGAVVSTGSLQLTKSDMAYRCRKASIKCLIADKEFAGRLGGNVGAPVCIAVGNRSSRKEPSRVDVKMVGL